MLKQKKQALRDGNTIGGRPIFIRETTNKNWARIHLSELNHRLVGMGVARNEVADTDPYRDVLAPYHDIVAVAERLEANLGNPQHYGDNTPGCHFGNGVEVVPEPTFTFWDLYQFGVTGEDGFAGFVRDCDLPSATTEFAVLVATGLLLVDKAVALLDEANEPFSTYLMGQAQDCAEYAVLEHLGEKEAGQIKAAIQDILKTRGSTAAKERYSKDKDGKQSTKAWVNECWKSWQKEPSKYQSAAAFARDMLDKQPDKLTSEVVVTRWVRAWTKKAN